MNGDTRRLTAWTAAIVTTAVFAKTFLPFYLVGSTPIFAAACAVGFILVAISWRATYDVAVGAADILFLLAAFYCLVIFNFLIQSRHDVPITHLIGILVFHALFMLFGLSAARAPKIFLMLLLGAAAIYLIVAAHYAIRFGDLMKQGYLNDIFGTGTPEVFVTFHQNIGIVLGLGMLAAIGLSSNRARLAFAVAALPLVLLFMFYIAARGAMVALVGSVIFFAGATAWVRWKTATLLAATALVVTVTIASSLFYQRALQEKNLDPLAADAISRTIREVQDPRPGFRMQIWAGTWHRISSEPDRLLFGRGIGMYPVIEGFGAPDWLLRKSKGTTQYPHNVYLEMLYEAGISGLVLFGILTLFPLAVALKRWHLFSLAQKSIISMYVFQLFSAQLSGAFAIGYLDQFFFALAVGIISLHRVDDVLIRRPIRAEGTE